MSCCSQPLDLAGLFAALADATRLRLLNLIADHEVCVCNLVEILGQSQPKISRHLAYLRKAGVVTARREGKWMHYSICTPGDAVSASILTAALIALEGDPQMQAERVELACARCAPDSQTVPAHAVLAAFVAARASS